MSTTSLTDTALTPAFCGIPFADPADIPAGSVGVVVGAGYSLGAPHPGTENGPFFLRTVSKEYAWGAANPAVFDLQHGSTLLSGIVDVGDLRVEGMTLENVLSATEQLVATLPPEIVPGVIGGDHTVTLPVVGALAKRRSRPFSVVQFDHHLDLQIWDGAPADPQRPREPVFHTNVMSHVSDVIGPGRLIQVGVSPFVTIEAESASAMAAFLRTVGRQISVSAPEIDDEQAFRRIVGAGEDVYLTVDLDVLDHTEMSSTGYPATIGLSVRRLLRLIDLALEGNRLIGFDVVEFAAERGDRASKTLADAQRAALIFLHLLGWVRRQAGEPARS